MKSKGPYDTLQPSNLYILCMSEGIFWLELPDLTVQDHPRIFQVFHTCQLSLEELFSLHIGL